MLPYTKYNDICVFSTNYGSVADIFTRLKNYNPRMHYVEPDVIEWTYEQKVEYIKKLCLFRYSLRNIVYNCSANIKDIYVISGANELRALAEFYSGELSLSGYIGEDDVHGLSYNELPFSLKRIFLDVKMVYLNVRLGSDVTMEEFARELRDMLG